MSDNPLDKVPTHNRVSIRAVLVHDGEDASAALAEAGLVNAVAIPVIVGEELDLSGGILGNGFTPNLTAVLETEPDQVFKSSTTNPPGSAQSSTDSGQSRQTITGTLPAAFGIKPLAPVRRPGG